MSEAIINRLEKVRLQRLGGRMRMLYSWLLSYKEDAFLVVHYVSNRFKPLEIETRQTPTKSLAPEFTDEVIIWTLHLVVSYIGDDVGWILVR